MKLTTVIPALVLAAAATTAIAEDTATTTPVEETAIELLDPTVSFADAVAIANDKAEGAIQSMELDYLSDKPAYFVELFADLSQTEMVIDGLTGEVLMSDVLTFSSVEAMESIFMAEMMADGEDFCGIDEVDLADLEMFAELGLEPGDEVPADMLELLTEMDDHDFCDEDE